MKALHLSIYVLLLGASITWVTLGIDRGAFDRTAGGREQAYWSAAMSLHEGGMDTGILSASREPLYPRALASLGETPVAQSRRIQRGVLLTCASLLILVVLLRLHTGLVPALMGSLLPFFAGPLIVGATLFLPGLPTALLLLGAGLFLMGRFGWLPLGMAAVLTGIALWTSPLLGWVTLLLLVAALWRSREPSPKWTPLVFLGASLVFALGLGQFTGSERILPNISGIEMYQGHRALSEGGQPLATDTDAGRFWGRFEFAAHGSREAGHALSPEDLDRYWGTKAFKESFQHLPGELLRTGKKFWLILNPMPLTEPITPTFAAQRADSRGLLVALWIGRLLLPLGFVGLFLARKSIRPEIGFLGASGFLAAWVSFARDDLRSLTLLILCAGVGLFVKELTGVARRRAFLWGAVAVGTLGILPAFLSPDSGRLDGLNSYWLGTVYAQEGRGSAALREFDRSLAFAPDSPLPRLAVADLLVRDQVIDEAISELEIVRDEYPDLVIPLFPLARLYEQRERWNEAAVIHQALIDINPYSADFHNNLGTTFIAAGYLGRAEAKFREALALDSRHVSAFTNLSRMQNAGLATHDVTSPEGGPYAVMALIREQQFEEAERVLARSYTLDNADTTQLRFLEGTLYFQKQEFSRAISVFEPLIPMFGGNPMFLHNLAASYASVGRLDEAMGIWVKLVKSQPGNQMFRTSLNQCQQQVVTAAIGATGAEARSWWQILIKHFPHRTAYAESLKAATP